MGRGSLPGPLVPLTRGHASRQYRQVHTIRAVKELVPERPVHARRQLEEHETYAAQAHRPLHLGPSCGISPTASCTHGSQMARAASHSRQSQRVCTSSLHGRYQQLHALRPHRGPQCRSHRRHTNSHPTTHSSHRVVESLGNNTPLATPSTPCTGHCRRTL